MPKSTGRSKDNELDSLGSSANILIVTLKAVFGPLAAKSAALPPPLAYGLPIIVTILLIAVIRPAVPANLAWLLALVIVAPLACYIATLAIVRGPHGPMDSTHPVTWAEIEYPDSQQVVERTIKCHGSAKGIPKNMHLWLAVEERTFIWPKENEIFVIDGQWKGKIYEDGVADQFAISLLMADSKAHTFIQNWLDAGRRGEGYSTLTGVEGATRIARVDKLRLKPNA
jgi:hypothetical protein